MFATKIHLNTGCEKSNRFTDIHSIFIVGYIEEKFYPADEIHDYLMSHPNSMKVDVFPYPFLIPAAGPMGEKCVQSIPDDSGADCLMALARG